MDSKVVETAKKLGIVLKKECTYFPENGVYSSVDKFIKEITELSDKLEIPLSDLELDSKYNYGDSKRLCIIYDVDRSEEELKQAIEQQKNSIRREIQRLKANHGPVLADLESKLASIDI